MLRQFFIIYDGDVKYQRDYADALSLNDIYNLIQTTSNSEDLTSSEEIKSYTLISYNVSYIMGTQRDNNNKPLYFIMVTSISTLMDDIKKELRKFRNFFENTYLDFLDDDGAIDFNLLNPTLDGIHRSLKPKISLVGYAGVGKTTITRLIKEESIPTQHIPTITGEVTSVKIGKLTFNLWDFAGQEQFEFLWNKFIKGSDAVLLITNSTLENVEKSKFFLNLIHDEAPYARCAVIGNKQDLPDAMTPEKISQHLDFPTYPMVAIDTNNREKMINIISDVLGILREDSPLLKPLQIRDNLIKEFRETLLNIESDDAVHKAIALAEKIKDVCIDLGDDEMAKDFNTKIERFQAFL